MSLEDEVKAAFKKHEDDARADGQSWDAVQKKVRRAHTQRLVYSSALSLVIIAAIAIIVVKSPSSNQSRGFTGPSETPTGVETPSPSDEPSTTPTPKDPTKDPLYGFKWRVGVQSGFAVAIPKDWKGGWFEGVWDFEPSGLPSTSQGGNTFAITITVEPGSYRDAPSGARASEITIHDRRALTWSTDPHHVSYAVDWPGCPDYASACSANAATQRLIMRLYGSTQSLWDSYEALGRKAALSVVEYDGLEALHGTVDLTIKIDDLRRALVRFMDARVEGIGADELMGTSASNSYNSDGGLYELNGNPATTYDIIQRTGNEFEISIAYGNSRRYERIEIQQGDGTAAPTVEKVCIGCTS